MRWILLILTILAVAIPVAAQSSSTSAGITVQQTVSVDAQGNTVVTERTLRNGVLIKEEVKVTSPQGALVREEETTFDAAGQPVSREVKILRDGVLVEQKFELRNGTLTLVSERQESVRDNSGPGNENDADDDDEHENEHEDEGED